MNWVPYKAIKVVRVYRRQNVERCPRGPDANDTLFVGGYRRCGETRSLKMEEIW
jgi:hypothetical protein